MYITQCGVGGFFVHLLQKFIIILIFNSSGIFSPPNVVLKIADHWSITDQLTNVIIIRPSPVPELSLPRALYRGWPQARKERVQDNLHAHAQNEPIRSEECGVTCLGRARYVKNARSNDEFHYVTKRANKFKEKFFANLHPKPVQ